MTRKDSDRLADSIETLASAVEGNTQEMKALRDAIDDLRTSYEYAVRNAECPYIVEAKDAAERHPNQQLELIAELIRLSIVEGFAEALDRVTKRKGRKGSETAFAEEDARAMGLAPEQTAQANAEGVETPLGLRRVEKNSRGKQAGGTLF